MINPEDIFDVEMVDVKTLERHSWKWNEARHKMVITDGPEDGSKIATMEPISGPEEGA